MVDILNHSLALPNLTIHLIVSYLQSATVAAATGYSSHRLDFVSESYGAVKAKDQAPEEASKKKDSSAERLWDVVRQETIVTVTTKRVKLVFEDEMNDKRDLSLKEYKSKRELMEDYVRREGFGYGLRHRHRCVFRV